MRAAVFFLITPRFTALSIAAYAFGRNVTETPLLESASVNSRTAALIARFRRILNTAFRFEARFAFFAELVIAICGEILHEMCRVCNDTDMIGHIAGVVHSIHENLAIISANGVGYKIATTKETLGHLAHGKPASLWTHLAVRDDALNLYGFGAEKDLRFFELLLTVPGIGPKSALAILDIANRETLCSAISSGNSSYMTKVSGIGKKTAEKIVLELKDKVGRGEKGDTQTLRGDEDALLALRALGYSSTEARDTLRKVPQKVKEGKARLREALKLLGS